MMVNGLWLIERGHLTTLDTINIKMNAPRPSVDKP